MGHTVLYIDSKHPDLAYEQDIVGPEIEILNPRVKAFADCPATDLGRSEGLIVSYLPVGPEEIRRLPRMRIVLRNGVGFDNVDLEACGAAGIPVCNIPDYGTTDVADSAIAIMLAFARGTVAFEHALRSDLATGWTHLHNVTARRLRGATFGVLGLGRIGTAAALRARAFGMEVMFHDPWLPNGAELALGFRRARTLAEMLGAADVISIHAPLNDDTRMVIDAKAVAAAKPGLWIINTARGPICDTAALVEGLRSGRLGAVGLDVLPKEPAALADPLVAAWHANEPWIRGRVILNPHSGFYSPDALADQRRKAIETVVDYLRAGRIANCVNTGFLQKGR